ncbi:MAG: DegT/DnrJ/EryC1/StrS family aminotransferase [Cyclobacteriaceae bacterium]
MDETKHNIKTIDLQSQHLKIKEEIDIAIQEVLRGAQFIKGPQVDQFQEHLEKYLNVHNVIPCGNGTDAIQLALMALDLPKQSEVIIPTLNYVSGADICVLLGLKPVFVDVDPKSFNVTSKETEKAITKNTKAIIVVHLYGQVAEMESIIEVAKANDLIVIEDTAQALGASVKLNEAFKKAGTIGDIGTTSFYPTKNLGGMGDGGAVFTNNDILALKMRQIAFQGQTKKYQYDIIGFNSRLDTIQAAILDVKLKYLDAYIQTKQEVANFYDRALVNHSGIEIPFVHDKSTHTYHQYTIKVKNRGEMINRLDSASIPWSIYYPSPLHLEKAFSYLNYQEGDLQNAESLCKQILSLPIHTELTEDQLEFVVEVLGD